MDMEKREGMTTGDGYGEEGGDHNWRKSFIVAAEFLSHFSIYVDTRTPRLTLPLSIRYSLAKDDTLEEMVSFLVNPPPPSADEKRVHKYPYMTCEVICCENDHVLDALISMKDGMMLQRIFSLLDTEGELDDRLSGYFEKVVFALLRRKCQELMAFLNGGGLPLFRKFVRHLNNYSIMQVVERLFLFQPVWDGQAGGGGGGQQQVGLDIGESGGEDASGSGHAVDLSLLTCQWSSMPEVVDILVDQLVERGETQAAAGEEEGRERGQGGQGTAATHTHVASLLLEVIDHASPDSIFIRCLTDKVARLVEIAIPALDLTQPSEVVAAQALAVVKEERSSMLSALTIVEALLSRPQAIKLQWDMGQQQIGVLASPLSPPLPVEESMPDAEGEGEDTASPAAPAPAADQQESTPPSSSSSSSPCTSFSEQPHEEGDTPTPDTSPLPASSDGASPTIPTAPAVEVVNDGPDGASKAFSFGKSSGVANLSEEVVEKLIASLPHIRIYLQTHESDTRTVATQVKDPAPKLGLTRLKLVRHVEALVKLCSARVDRPLEDGGILKVCLDMLFKYEWTSVLHQSITRIVTWIMDAGPSRLGLQTYLVKEGAILERILDASDYNDRMEAHDVMVEEGSEEGAMRKGMVAKAKGKDMMEDKGSEEARAAAVADAAAEHATGPMSVEMECGQPVPMNVEGGEEGREGEEETFSAIHPVAPAQGAATAAIGVSPLAPACSSLSMTAVNVISSTNDSFSNAAATAGHSSNRGLPRCRRGYMGHVFIMSQAIMEAARYHPPLLEEGGDEGAVDVDVDDPIVAGLLLSAAEGRGPSLSLSSSSSEQQQKLQQLPAGDYHPSMSTTQDSRPSFAQVMETVIDPALKERWLNFTQGKLAQVTAIQSHPLGGYPIPSRADENKLTTTFGGDNSGEGGEGEGGPDFDVISDHLAQRLSGVEVGSEGGVGEEGGGEQQMQEGGAGSSWRRGDRHQMQEEKEDDDEEGRWIAMEQRQAEVRMGRDPFENDESIFPNDKESFEMSSRSRESNGHEEGEESAQTRKGHVPGLVAGGWAAKAFAEGAPSGGTFGEGWADFSSVSFPPLDTLTMPLGSAAASNYIIGSGRGRTPVSSDFDDVPGFMGMQAGGGAGGGGDKVNKGNDGDEEEDSNEEEDDFFSSSTTVHLKRGTGTGPRAVAAAAAAAAAEAAVDNSNDLNDEENNSGDGEDGDKVKKFSYSVAVATTNSVQQEGGGSGGGAGSTSAEIGNS